MTLMATASRRLFLIGMILSTGAVVSSIGCSDSRYQGKRTIRDERIRFTTDQAKSRESRSTMNLKSTLADARRLEKQHHKKLAKTRKEMRKHYDFERKRWVQRESERRRALNKSLAGKPEEIPETFLQMAN